MWLEPTGQKGSGGPRSVRPQRGGWFSPALGQEVLTQPLPTCETRGEASVRWTPATRQPLSHPAGAPAPEAEAGAGNGRADAPAAAPSATSREIARSRAGSQSRAFMRGRGAAAARKLGTPASVLAQNSLHGAFALRIGARVKRHRLPLAKMAAVEASL